MIGGPTKKQRHHRDGMGHGGNNLGSSVAPGARITTTPTAPRTSTTTTTTTTTKKPLTATNAQSHTTSNKTINRALNGNPVSGKAMVEALKKEGFVVDRVSGSHVILEGPLGQSVSVPVHSNRDLAIGTLNNILRQAGFK